MRGVGTRLMLYPRGKHQISDQAQPTERAATHRQQGEALRALRTSVKTAVQAAAGEDDVVAAESLKEAVRSIDRAAAKGLIHKNQAANRKSRLMKRLTRPTA